MKKRGFLLAEETLKIVVAAICIGVLVYFLTSIYLKSQENKNLELAKSSLEHLIGEVNSGASEVDIYNPKGWVISSWPHDTTKRIWYTFFILSETKKGLPRYCENLDWGNCLCVCKKNDKDECDNLGYCLESDIIINEGSIEIEKPLPLNLKINEGVISK